MDFDAMFHDLARFWASFSSQNRYKIGSRTEDLENRKTLQNTAWASKIQGLGSQKTMENHRRKASDGDCEKKRLKISKNVIFGAPGDRFGSRKRKICEDFAESKRERFFEAMEPAARQPKSAGLGALRLSPWSFKGLGLLSLSLC